MQLLKQQIRGARPARTRRICRGNLHPLARGIGSEKRQSHRQHKKHCARDKQNLAIPGIYCSWHPSASTLCNAFVKSWLLAGRLPYQTCSSVTVKAESASRVLRPLATSCVEFDTNRMYSRGVRVRSFLTTSLSSRKLMPAQ